MRALSRHTASAVALALASAASAADAPRTPRPLPVLPREPKIDGALKDFPQQALSITGADPALSARLGFRKDTLYAAIEVADEVVLPVDSLLVSLHFPGAGATARGYEYRFGLGGARPSDAAPDAARSLLRAAVTKTDRGLSLELAIPPRALPRFPARGPLVLDVCVTYEDRDEPGAQPARTSNCDGGATKGGPLRVPDELRKQLKVAPPERVEALEARPGGWVGYSTLHYPAWVLGDAQLDGKTLPPLVADEPMDPVAMRIPLPGRMDLPDGRPLIAVLSGKDPFGNESGCSESSSLRLAFYALKGRVAQRVLEWPAATCALGRAVSIALDEEGGLTIGYSNGSLATFIWSADHFERTELGSR